MTDQKEEKSFAQRHPYLTSAATAGGSLALYDAFRRGKASPVTQGAYKAHDKIREWGGDIRDKVNKFRSKDDVREAPLGAATPDPDAVSEVSMSGSRDEAATDALDFDTASTNDLIDEGMRNAKDTIVDTADSIVSWQKTDE